MAADDLEDVDVAAKAPESDARERLRGINPAMGTHCVSDRPAPQGLQPRGEITSLNGIDAYISKPQFYPSRPAKLLLLLSPGTGLRSINNQLQADQWADAGYVVIMPDQFGGDTVDKMDTSDTSVPPAEGVVAGEGGDGVTAVSPPTPAATNAAITSIASDQDQTLAAAAQSTTEQTVSSWVDRIKQTVLDTAKSFRIDMWLARHTPQTVLPRLVSVLGAARDVYADAVAYGGGVYGAGYCFGGRYVLLLLGELPDEVVLHQGSRELGSTDDGSGGGGGGTQVDSEAGAVRKGTPLLKAGVLAHGTSVAREDFAALGGGRGETKGQAGGDMTARLGIVAVKDDPLFPDEVRDYGIKSAADKGVEVQERVWEGVPHGFAVVGEYQDQEIVKAQSEAHAFMVEFLEKS